MNGQHSYDIISSIYKRNLTYPFNGSLTEQLGDKMKKSLLIIALLSASFAAFTDDGGSYKPEDWTYGNIYVKEPKV